MDAGLERSLRGLGAIDAAADAAFFAGDFAGAAGRLWALFERRPDDAASAQRLLHCLDATCDWRRRPPVADAVGRLLGEEAAGLREPSFEPLCHVSVDLDAATACRLAERRAEKARHLYPLPGPESEGSRGGRLRLGYLSVDFLSHSAGVPLWPMIAAHDRERFEVFGYHLGPPGPKADIAAAFDVWRDLSAETMTGAAAVIREDAPDILVDTARHIRGWPLPLAAAALAPCRVSAWGYGGPPGTGADVVAFSPYHPLHPPPSAALTTDRAEHGLPEAGTAFAAFCNPYKLDEATFSLWLDVIEACPGSVLWLAQGCAAVRDNLTAFAAGRGVAPERLVFAAPLGQAEHLQRLALADMVLYNARMGGGAALWQGLAMGVPGVALAGNSWETFSGDAILGSMGLSDLVAATPAEYLELAAKGKSLRQRPAGPWEPAAVARAFETMVEAAF